MGNRRPLLMHKTEWDRLKEQSTSPVHYHKQLLQKQKNEYLKPLIEQSQNWIKSWPDTGHANRVEKIKKQQYDKDIALIKYFIEKTKRDLPTDAIQKARQQIFEDSCYGKQLLSALRESKTLEERDAQLKFKEKLKQKESQHHIEVESKALTQQSYLDFDKDVEGKNHLKRLKNIEIAQINRSIYKMRKERRSREKEHERQMRKEDELLAKKFQEAEALAKEKEIIRRRKDIVEYKEEQKRALMQKIKLEKLTKALDELWQKYQEKKQCKEKRIFNKLLKNNYDTIESHKHYDLIQKLYEDKEMEYEEFIKKGIELHEKELKLKAEEDNQNQEKKHENIQLLVQYNKIAAEQCKGVKTCKDTCDRQCILAQSRKNRKSSVYVPDAHKYLERLRKREEEPAAWTGASAAHEQFAQFAKRILQDSRYKLMAQKVIDNYIKTNHLDSKTFP